MITTLRWTLFPALAALFLVGCDSTAPADPGAPPKTGDAAALADPAAAAEALAAALHDPDAFARARNLGELLPALGPEAVPSVRQTLEGFRLDLGAVEFDLLMRFWATHEPAEAMTWTFKHASPLYQNEAARTVVEIWAEADPAAAVVAVETALPEADEDVARIAERALVRGWYQVDPPGLEQYMYGLGSGIKRQRALFAYVLSLTQAKGSDAAIGWAESIPEEDLRYKHEVYRQLMAGLSWADTPAAMRFCESNCDGRFGSGLRNVLVRMMLRRGDDGGEVVEWVARPPEENETQRKDKLHSLWVAYSTWAYRDRDAAVAWMGEKTANEEVEPWVRVLYGEYARQLAADSPAEAIQWAERVEDEADRELTLIRIARHWRMKDEEAAEAWLAQSSLSDSAREQARDTTAPDYLPKRPQRR